MLRTINDLIDISRIEAGQMNTVFSDVDINEQINDLYAFFLPEAEEKGVELKINQTLKDADAILYTDYEKLYGVLTNLVKNAIKFTRKGNIEFGYEKKDNRVEFYVKDTGIGIPKDRQKAIFDRFIQADMALANHYEGAGLGLAISIAYVKMLGGKMWLNSTIDIGSTFHFTIPYKKSS
jgi:signal transduction histidine kinase